MTEISLGMTGQPIQTGEQPKSPEDDLGHRNTPAIAKRTNRISSYQVFFWSVRRVQTPTVLVPH